VAKTHEGFFPILHQIFASLFFYVPRSIWPSKPNDTGLELGNLLGLRFQNLSAPWLLEAYVNGRIFGVIFLSIILGFLLTRLDLNVKDNFKYFVISSLTSGFLFIILRGSLLQATGRTVCAILLALFIFKGIRHGLKP
jgi:hypothetical protein